MKIRAVSKTVVDADTELSETDIAELGKLFDLLAKYDHEDKQKKNSTLTI